MTQQSAGLLPFKYVDGALYVMLVHPGGPFFTNKDEGAWSTPKGLVEDGEDLLTAARREFREEGELCQFPEIDRGGWFTIEEARIKIQRGQEGFIDALIAKM